MRLHARRALLALAAVGISVGSLAPAMAGKDCNSGNGNGSELREISGGFHPESEECDPGNSPGRNNGGD